MSMFECRDRIEFYLRLEDGHIAIARSSHAPSVGEKVCIRSKTYVVESRSYTVDHASEWDQTSVVCVIKLGEQK